MSDGHRQHYQQQRWYTDRIGEGVTEVPAWQHPHKQQRQNYPHQQSRRGGKQGGSGSYQRGAAHGRPPQPQQRGHAQGYKGQGQRQGSGRSQHHQQSHSQAPFRQYPRQWLDIDPAAIQAGPLAIADTAAHSSLAAASSASASTSAPSSPFPRPPISLKLVCYNVLCGAYIEPDFFPKAPAWVLADTFRRTRIIQQLTAGMDASQPRQGQRPGATAATQNTQSKHHQSQPRPLSSHPLSHADIIALQEVDSYSSFWLPELSSRGYGGVFKARTAVQAKRADGSAIFFNKKKFDLVDTLEIDYCIYPTHDTKDNVGVAVLLRSKEDDIDEESQQEDEGGEIEGKQSNSSSSLPPRYVAVLNTHLLFNTRRGDLKLGQVQIMLNSLDAWLNQWCREYTEQRETETEGVRAGTSSSHSAHPSISIILCGDMNLLPSSPLMQFMREGSLNLESDTAFIGMKRPERRMLARQEMSGQEQHDHRSQIRKEKEKEKRRQKQAANTNANAATQNPQESTETDANASDDQHATNKRRRLEGAHENGTSPSLLSSDETQPPTSSSSSPTSTDAADASSSNLTMSDLVELELARSEPLPPSPASSSNESESGSGSEFESDSGSASANGPSRTLFPARGRSNRRHIPDFIQSFFPFSPMDTPTHIRYGLPKLMQVLVDRPTIEQRHKLALVRMKEKKEEKEKQSKRSSEQNDADPYSIDASLSPSSTFIDPLTGVPIRYRPSAHHSRFSGQVDHILFSPVPYTFNPSRWTRKQGSTPKEVMEKKLGAQERQIRNQQTWDEEDQDDEEEEENGSESEEMDDSDVEIISPPPSNSKAKRTLSSISSDATSASTPSTATSASPSSCTSSSSSRLRPWPGSLRVASIFEFPPIAAFEPQYHMKTVRVSHKLQKMSIKRLENAQIQQQASQHAAGVTATTTSTDAAPPSGSSSATVPSSSNATILQQTQVEQRVRVTSHDPGLPVPDYPSDHFPLAIKFEII